MSYEHEYTSISIRVPKSFREQFNKTQEFWEELGDFFVKVAKELNKIDLNQLRIDHPLIFTFLEEMLP